MTQAIRSTTADGSLPALTFVLGGARSGKSAFAESLCLSAGLSCVYLATSQAWDDEMRDRIASHRDRRDARWQTIEEPLDLPPVLDRLDASQIVLLDCATLWLTNHLLAEHDLEAEQTALVAALARCAARVVVVSNEVGLSIVPENALARRFRDAQGRLNQALAAQAGLVVAVWAGLPLVLKGQLP